MQSVGGIEKVAVGLSKKFMEVSTLLALPSWLLLSMAGKRTQEDSVELSRAGKKQSAPNVPNAI